MRGGAVDAGVSIHAPARGATTLRHTFASWLAQKDIQLLKIAKLMGDTVAIVESTYAHLLPTDLRGAVERL